MSQENIPIKVSQKGKKLTKQLWTTLATLEGNSYSSTNFNQILNERCYDYYSHYGTFPFSINLAEASERVNFYNNVLVQAYPRDTLKDFHDYQVVVTIGKPGQSQEEVQAMQLEWLRRELKAAYVDDQERIYEKWLKTIPASTQGKIESEIHNHPEVLKAKTQLTKLNDELDNVRRGLADNLLWREAQSEMLLKKYNLVQYDQLMQKISKKREIKVQSGQAGHLLGLSEVEREIGSFVRTTKTSLITEAITEDEEANSKLKELYKDSLEAYWPKKIALESLVDKRRIALTQKLSQVEDKFRTFNNRILVAVIDIKSELMSKYQIVTDDPEIMEL